MTGTGSAECGEAEKNRGNRNFSAFLIGRDPMRIGKKGAAVLGIGLLLLLLSGCQRPAAGQGTLGPAGTKPESAEASEPAARTAAETSEPAARTSEEASEPAVQTAAETREDGSGMRSFYYAYNGSIGGDSFSYDVDTESGVPVLLYESMAYPDYGEMTMELPESFMESLRELYEECGLSGWDGFSGSSDEVLDGDGFSLRILFSDDETTEACGSNAYPEGYHAFRKKLDLLMAPYVEQLLEEGRQRIIGQGVSGPLEDVMATFLGHGSSGSDRYEMLITRQGIRRKNFDLRVTSESGAIFPEGDYNYYADLPDEAIDFEGIGDLIRTYGVMEWYGFDQASEDPDNSEWFQVSFGFEEGTIQAYGTAHPEHYEEFREAFLTLLYGMVRNAEENYGLVNRGRIQ